MAICIFENYVMYICNDHFAKNQKRQKSLVRFVFLKPQQWPKQHITFIFALLLVRYGTHACTCLNYRPCPERIWSHISNTKTKTKADAESGFSLYVRLAARCRSYQTRFSKFYKYLFVRFSHDVYVHIKCNFPGISNMCVRIKNFLLQMIAVVNVQHNQPRNIFFCL
jgi:hypothetical protein